MVRLAGSSRPTARPALGAPPRAARLAVVVLLSVAVAACEQSAVTWADPAAVSTGSPAPLAMSPLAPMDSALNGESAAAQFLWMQDLLREAGARSLLDSPLRAMPESRQTVAAQASLPAVNVSVAPDRSLGRGAAPLDSARCARSLRVIPAGARGEVAVWWSRATGGRVYLYAAWRDAPVTEAPTDSLGNILPGEWRGPIPVDTLDQGPGDAQAADRGSHGCARPAPSVAVDATNGYVHVAFALTGPEGAGVFYAHQMDPRSGFEPPVAIVYGDKLGTARVAADGEVVAVVYEDPNSGSRTQVGVAVSRTAGHLFEERLLASTTVMQARDPYVAVTGRGVVVGWSDMGTAGSEPAFRIRRARVR